MNPYVTLSKVKVRFFSVLLLLTVSLSGGYAQNVAIKTNLLYDALLTPDLGIEVKTAPQWTFEFTGNINFWTINNRRWRQWSVQPEMRYWFCQSFSGHFIGAHLFGGQYNLGNLPLNFKFLGTDLSVLRNYRFQGWMGGAGIAYGYSWILDRHWNFEAELGIGWLYTRYDKFKCASCGKKIVKNQPYNYFGPTKVAFNLSYTF